MKKITYFFAVIVVTAFSFSSCNKVPSSYGTTLPWTGIDPFSIIVKGKSLAPTVAAVAISPNDTTPNYIFSNITQVVNADTSVLKQFTIQLPRIIGGINEFKKADLNNSEYVIYYREILKKGTTVLNNKLYSTRYALPGGRIKLLNNDTYLKGIFNGYLNNEAYRSEYILIENGYFNAKK
jgi:hypothetical protein